MTNPIDALLTTMARLRDPATGCPWDIEQTFKSIAPHTIEEAYEVADAIERDNLADLKEELGDLLLQIVFHSRMAEELGAFAFDDVVQTLNDKLMRRHPHVFGDRSADTADDVVDLWEQGKAEERARKAEKAGRPVSVLDDVAQGLPALMRAVKLQKRMSRVGFDWNDPMVALAKVDEELEELRVEIAADDRVKMQDELGDVLFIVANLARHLNIDPEEALRGTNRKVERRFHYIEKAAAEAERVVSDMTLLEMQDLWREVKKLEKSAG
jgi:MazG family protein